MKKLFAFLLFGISFMTVASNDPLDAVGDRCGDYGVLYYGQTIDHSREVLLCQTGSNVTYQFGKVNEKPDIRLTIPAKLVSDLVTDNDTVSSEYLLIRNGNIVYQVGHLSDLLSGTSVESITVVKSGHGTLREILLDPDTTVNAIRDRFNKE